MFRWATFALVGHSLLQEVASTAQFEFESRPSGSEQHHRLEWKIKDVAIIGAGVSGLLAYQALIQEGTFEKIRVFERDDVPGGNWHYTHETPKSVKIDDQFIPHWWTNDFNATVPKHIPEKIIYHVGGNRTKHALLEAERIVHRLPKPLYRDLKANTPAPEQQIADFRWPAITDWETHHSKVQKYLRAFASWLGIGTAEDGEIVSYKTRVELVTKRLNELGNQNGWKLLLRRFSQLSEDIYEESWWEEEFDAVIAATGRFNVPWIPPITGVAKWQSLYPDRLIHSRQYRNPEAFRGRNVLVVGASASAVGIAQDLDGWTRQTFLSIRESSDDPRASTRRALHRNSIPPNTTIIGEIQEFVPFSQGTDISKGCIKLVNQTVLQGIDAVVFGTGYRYSFPFLPQYHTVNNTDPSPRTTNNSGDPYLVTDGTHVRSLYLDVFYIEQPTLAFQGLNVGVQTFVYGKYTGSAIAKVWSNHAFLPSRSQMWRQYRKTVLQRGGERGGLQWLGTELTSQFLNFFTSWLNTDAFNLGGDLLDIPLDVSAVSDIWRKARGVTTGSGIPSGQDLNDTPGEGGLSRAFHDDW